MQTTIVEVFDKILANNDKEAQTNREFLNKHNILCINLMSSPGSGKTTLLESTIKTGKFRLAVVEGDLETNNDANRIITAGAQAYQITTGQTCHLDALEVRRGLENLSLQEVDFVFVENIGNLVCPASYDVGAHINVVLLSVVEGSDKIAKYPVMFKRADAVVITKSGLLEHFDFDIEQAKRDCKELNPNVEFLVLDSKTQQGFHSWLTFLESILNSHKKEQ